MPKKLALYPWSNGRIVIDGAPEAVLPDAGERGATLIDVGRALLGPAGVVAVTLAAVYLTVRQVIWCWPLGMVSVTLYAWVFYDAKLYADMGLQVLYFALSVYGWWAWLHGGKDHGKLTVVHEAALAVDKRAIHI